MDVRPDTYYLQQAVERGLAAIHARLDPAQGHRPFFMLRLGPEPELQHDKWDLGDMCSRYVDAFVMGRQVTGSALFGESERRLTEMLLTCDPYLEPFMAGRMLIVYVSLFLRDRTPESRGRVTHLVRVIKAHLIFAGDFAYYFRAHDGWTSVAEPIFGSFEPYPTYPIGGIMLALARYLEEEDDTECADLLERLTVFVLRESGTFEPDGSYLGHTHSGGILTAAVAIFRRALHVDDTDRAELMRSTLDWTLAHCSSWGWVPDGLGGPDPSSETCSIADALHFVLLAARHADSGYYGVAERFARNQLMENQYRSPERALPDGEFPNREAIARALDGSWASWSLPNSLDNGLESVEGCCLGSGVRACCLVWESSIERTPDAVRVNMAFSRNSPWAEVVSFLPHRGQIDVIMHTDAQLQVRAPERLAQSEMEIVRNGRPSACGLTRDGYLNVPDATAGEHITIRFPMTNREADEIVSGRSYRVTWRGDTAVGIEPRGERYPLYERDWMMSEDPPMVSPSYHEQAGGPVRW